MKRFLGFVLGAAIWILMFYIIYGGLFFHGRTYRSGGHAFAENHILADFNDPIFFNSFWYPGCPDCNNMTDYLMWREDHPEYKPPKTICRQCHDHSGPGLDFKYNDK